MRDDFTLGLRYLLLVVVPSSVALAVLAQPAVAVLVRGGFDAQDATVTADTLQAFALGLVPFSVYLFTLARLLRPPGHPHTVPRQRRRERRQHRARAGAVPVARCAGPGAVVLGCVRRSRRSSRSVVLRRRIGERAAAAGADHRRPLGRRRARPRCRSRRSSPPRSAHSSASAAATARRRGRHRRRCGRVRRGAHAAAIATSSRACCARFAVAAPVAAAQTCNHGLASEHRITHRAPRSRRNPWPFASSPTVLRIFRRTSATSSASRSSR